MKEAKNATPWIVLSVIAVAAIAYAAYVLSMKNGEEQPPVQQACTLEAKLCADGSYVGRVGPTCEFSPCPGTPPPSIQ